MLLVWILTWILESLNFTPAVELWHWYGENPLLTILLILIFA